MDFGSIGILTLGSTVGLILRIFIQSNLKINMGFDIQNTSIVNFMASFFLGMLVALNFINNQILLLFYTGFLGSFSTFSSFIYQLFILFEKRKFFNLFFHYFGVICLGFDFYHGSKHDSTFSEQEERRGIIKDTEFSSVAPRHIK